MSSELERLRSQAALLAPDERAQLALELLQSLDGAQEDDDVDAAWNAEAVRRLEAFDRGEIATISAEALHRGDPLPSAR